MFPDSDFGVALTTPTKVYRRRKCRHCYRKTKKRLQQSYRKELDRYKKQQRCSRCGLEDHRVLDYHHQGEKDFSLGNAVRNGYGWKRIAKEMEKCIVLCANCHRILHYEQRRV